MKIMFSPETNNENLSLKPEIKDRKAKTEHLKFYFNIKEKMEGEWEKKKLPIETYMDT